MVNSSSCRSCDGRAARIQAFGTEFPVKALRCSPDGVHYEQKRNLRHLQITLCPTFRCAGSCPFCAAAPDRDRPGRLDPARTERLLRRLKEEDLVRGVDFSGGEPLADAALLDELVELVFSVLGRETEVSIHTNGTNLDQLLRIRSLPWIDAIHISRHHYDNQRNRRLFGCAVPDGAALREIARAVPFREQLVFNCVLLRDEIGSPEEAHRFLDFALDVGVPKTGFITVMPVNDYARAQRVPYQEVLRPDDPALLFTRRFYDGGICSCADGVYAAEDGRVTEFYGRGTCPGDPGYARGLVFTPDHVLRAGFGGPVILREETL